MNRRIAQATSYQININTHFCALQHQLALVIDWCKDECWLFDASFTLH